VGWGKGFSVAVIGVGRFAFAAINAGSAEWSAQTYCPFSEHWQQAFATPITGV